MTHRPRKDETGEFPAIIEPVKRSERIIGWFIASLVAASIVLSFVADSASAAQRCNVPRSATVKGERIDYDQRVNTTLALRLSDHMGTPYSHKVAVVAAATQEDSQRNRASGHGTSVGYLQLINLHGTVAWRMKVRNSAGWFLRGARLIDPRGTARLATKRGNWGLIQRIQRSGHPTKYNQWISESIQTVNKYRASCR